MANIVPFRRNRQRAPAVFQPAAGQVGRATKVAAAAQLANAVAGVVSRLPARRRNGRGGGGQPGRAAAGNRRRPRRALQMPANVLYQERGGRTDFSSMTTKALQKKAWEYHPATSNLMAPRGLGYYDAFAMSCSSAVTSMTIGPTTPITGITVIPRIATDYNVFGSVPGSLSDSDAQLLIIGPARGRTQARLWKANPSSTGSAADKALSEDFDCPQLSMDQPIDGIPARCSVQMKNFSNAFARGGRIRILRATTGRTLIPTLTTNGDLWELMDGIRSHWRTATYDGEDFSGKGSSSMQKNAIVLDQTRTLQFGAFDIHKPLDESGLWWEIQRYKGDVTHGAAPTEHDPAVTIAASDLVYMEEEAAIGNVVARASDGVLFEATAARQHPHAKALPDIDAFTEYTANPTFTPIFILFEPCVTGISGGGVTGNEYEVKVCSQFHCHFKQGSTLANMAKEPRTNLGAINSATHAEESLGSYMKRAAMNELRFQRQRLFGV